MPPTFDSEMIEFEAPPPPPRTPAPPILPSPKLKLTTSNSSKPRTALPSAPQATTKALPGRPANPEHSEKPKQAGKKQLEKLLQTMDELDSYRQWSRLKKSMVPKAKVTKDKAYLRAYFNERQAKIGVSDDQIRRFKKLYDLVHQCDLLHANDGKENRELKSSTKETQARPTATRVMQGQGKKTGPPVEWKERSSPLRGLED